MTCVQLGLAASIGLMDHLGAAGTAWLRLTWAALLILVVVRPRPGRFDRDTLRAGALLGVVTAGVTLCFMEAVARIPLGTASALEFTGPLAVAVARSRGPARAWAALAAVGVVLLTEPWAGSTDPVGVAFALAAAACWGGYILLTQRVGDGADGIAGLAVSLPVAAVVASVVAGPATVGRLDPEVLLLGLGLAVLLPLVPFALEMLALRQLEAAAFGTLMALEPAIALTIGLLVLGQQPGLLPAVGVVAVVLAGVGAARTGRRTPAPVAAALP